MLFSTLTSNAKRAARRSASNSPRQAADWRPQLEALERRWLLSTVTVTSPADSGAGSLRAAITAAQSGDTIVFAPTLFSSTAVSISPKKGKGKSPPQPPPPPPPANTIVLTSGQLTLTKNLTIQGLGADQLIISGNYASRVFEVTQGATVTLSGMTIIKSASVIYGGGILNSGTLTVSNSRLYWHTANYGGGIYNAGGKLTIGNSSIEGNNGSSGAGIYNAGGVVAISSSTMTGNQATYGGGIYNSSGTLSVTNSNISSNRAHFDYSVHGGHGGGIYNSAGSATISNTILSGNSADGGWAGGGVYNAAGATVTVTNFSSITGNTGGYEGVDTDVMNLGVLYRDGTSTIGILAGNSAISI